MTASAVYIEDRRYLSCLWVCVVYQAIQNILEDVTKTQESRF